MVLVTDVEIIVSRYNETLDWTLMEPFNQFKYTVYNKGNDELFEKTHVTKIINLPNIGRNDHTYLYHIVTNYNNLSLITVFFPGSINLKYKLQRAKTILTNIMRPNNDKGVFIGHKCASVFEKFKHFYLNEYVCSSKMNRMKNSESKLKVCAMRPYGNWYRTFFGKEDTTIYTYWGIFSIHRTDIVQHEVNRYNTLLSMVSTHSNPEAGHYIERSWGKIFHPMKFTEFYREPPPREPTQNKMKMSLAKFQLSPKLPRQFQPRVSAPIK
jgi:hypothetical protein